MPPRVAIPGLFFAFALSFIAAFSPAPLAAQFGGIDSLARRINSASFYFNWGGLSAGSSGVAEGDQVWSFGLETLIEIGTVTRRLSDPPNQASSSEAARDSVNLEWTRMEVVRQQGQSDTTYYYEIEAVSRTVQVDTLWVFELGLGYGQLSGFESDRSEFDLRGSIRDLPAVSLYATHEPSSVYFGLRSGFMKLQDFRIYDSANTAYSAKGESFMAGGVVGYSIEAGGLYLLFEGGYTVRRFPSLEWNEKEIPVNIPRELSVSGWSVGAGIQFPVGGS